MGVRKRRVLRASPNSLKDPVDLGSLDPDWSGFVLYKGTLGIPQCPWTVTPGEVVSIPIRIQQLAAIEQELAHKPPAPPVPLVPTIEQLRSMTYAEIDAYWWASRQIKDEVWRMLMQRKDEETSRQIAKLKAESEAAQLERKRIAAERRALKDAKRRKPRVDFYFGTAMQVHAANSEPSPSRQTSDET